MRNYKDIVLWAIDQNADINCMALNGNTPIILSVIYNNLDLMGLLVMNGAKLNLANDYGNTLMHYAIFYKHDYFIKNLYTLEQAYCIPRI